MDEFLAVLGLQCCAGAVSEWLFLFWGTGSRVWEFQ